MLNPPKLATAGAGIWPGAGGAPGAGGNPRTGPGTGAGLRDGLIFLVFLAAGVACARSEGAVIPPEHPGQSSPSSPSSSKSSSPSSSSPSEDDVSPVSRISFLALLGATRCDAFCFAPSLDPFLLVAGVCAAFCTGVTGAFAFFTGEGNLKGDTLLRFRLLRDSAPGPVGVPGSEDLDSFPEVVEAGTFPPTSFWKTFDVRYSLIAACSSCWRVAVHATTLMSLSEVGLVTLLVSSQ